MSEPEENFHITNATPPPPSREKPMGFWEHLEELRGTIIKSVVTFVIFAALIGYFIKEFNDVVMWPLRTVQVSHPNVNLELGTQGITEVFSMILQMCVMGGIVLAAPFILFFIGQFVAPALTEKELKAVLPMCVSALILFLLGAAFGFFLLMPTAIETSVDLNVMFQLVTRWTVADYYRTMSWLVLGVGATFEFPLLIILLVWLGVMSTDFLRKYRRHAIVLICVAAAIITPTQDPITLIIFAVPLYVLYELAVIASSRVEKRKKRAL